MFDDVVPAFKPMAFLNAKELPRVVTDDKADIVFGVPPDAEWCVLKAEDFPHKLDILYNLTFKRGDILLCLRYRLPSDRGVRFHVMSKLHVNDARMLAIALAYASIGPEV